MISRGKEVELPAHLGQVYILIYTVYSDAIITYYRYYNKMMSVCARNKSINAYCRIFHHVLLCRISVLHFIRFYTLVGLTLSVCVCANFR